MSSTSDFNDAVLSDNSSSSSPTRPVSRRQSQTPLTPRKRRRLESIDPSRVRKYHLEGKYSDAYRVLFNEDVSRAAARFEKDARGHQYYTTQIGASLWSANEQAIFFAALERLGRDDIAGIAGAIGTKSIPETQELMLLLQDAAIKQGDAKLTLRDVPAAVEVRAKCNEQLDLAGEALAWYQELYEANQEREKFGDYWLITPAVADKIEAAIDPRRSRETTTPIVSESESRRGGRVVSGACLSCKKFKQKCDRQRPCSNCQRRMTDECVYPCQTAKPDENENNRDKTSVTGILEALPEAILLQPQAMLALSKSLFMNRSPTIPSPWPHWSEYTSEIAQEPSIYRSAFGDLHTLVVSLTRRLMQTAIIQATSRLRSQRHRVKKSAIPLIKRRDVLAAIDIVGLQRNGQERWRGVARRCGVRVYDGKWSRHRHSRTKREVPWDKVEQIMTSVGLPTDALTTDAETSDNDEVEFRSRAARRGTPLPMERLALSDSGESMIDETPPTSQRVPQVRDPTGRYTSLPPTPENEERRLQYFSLEQFDREASRQEEQSLWTLLDLEPPTKDAEYKSDDYSDEDILGEDEKIITHPGGWRSWTDYRAEWEEFDDPVSPAEFAANQKPLPAQPTLQQDTAGIVDPSSNDDIAVPSQRRKPQRRPKPRQIELQTWGTRAYANLQGRASQHLGSMGDTSSQDANTSDDDDAAADDRPIPSIEDQRKDSSPAPVSSHDPSVEEMDQPTQSNEIDIRPVAMSSSDDESGGLSFERPVPPIDTRRMVAPVMYSDDEVGEMDWDSYID